MGEETDRSAVPEQALDIFASPLDEFTSARNALARELKEQGLKTEAERVGALKKPTLSAWAVNQLARARAEEVGELMDVTDRIKDSATPEDVRSAVAERHKRVRDLVDAARTILEENGHAAGAGTLQQVMRTLYAAQSDDERRRVAEGTLERPLESSGFEAAPGLSLETAPAEDTAGGEDAGRKLEEQLAEAQERAARLDREAAKARLEADAADGEAAEARRLVMKLQDKLNRAGS
jgi:hypothetical protein